MPLNDNSLAKKLVRSTYLQQSNSQPSQTETVSRSIASSSQQPISESLPSNQSVQQHTVSSRETAEQQFLRWVNKLDERVQTLEGRIPSGDVGVLERDANTCKAELQHLYDYAATQGINLEGCYNLFVDIRDHLHSIDLKLEEKKEQIEKSKRPAWVKVVNIVVQAISLVSTILGLPQSFVSAVGVVQHFLPSGKKPKLLK